MSPARNQSPDDSLEPNHKRQKLDSDIKDSCSSNRIYISRKTRDLEQGIRIMGKEASAFTKRFISQKSWIEDKKLHLVLDLDQTLVQTIKVSKLSESDKYLIEEAESRTDLWRLKIGEPGEILIKLRPFVHEFLKQANEIFTMVVYTKSTYDYAQRILNLIDPDKIYFGDRVITRRESIGLKTLNFVLADERETLIVDDSDEVWPLHKRNLLKIHKYEYFRSNDVVETEERSSECGEKRDESDEKGPLVLVLSFLKYVHRRFFCELSEEKLNSMDVRRLLLEAGLRSKGKIQFVVLK